MLILGASWGVIRLSLAKWYKDILSCSSIPDSRTLPPVTKNQICGVSYTPVPNPPPYLSMIDMVATNPTVSGNTTRTSNSIEHFSECKDKQKGRPPLHSQTSQVAVFQGGGKPRPYYIRAWHADSLYSRGLRMSLCRHVVSPGDRAPGDRALWP
jgi:hypothetical protein